jgi:hypothetical protein
MDGADVTQHWTAVEAMESENGGMLALWDVILVALVIAMMAGVLTGGPQV